MTTPVTNPVMNGQTPIRIHVPTTTQTSTTDGPFTRSLDIPTTDLDRPHDIPMIADDMSRKAGRKSWRDKPWPLFIIGLAAAVAVWSGWVGLGQMAGFGVISPLPGIWDNFHLNTAVVLPLSVEAYAAYALRVWIGTTTHNTRALRFAKYSAITSMAIGAIAQVAYHLMAAAGYQHAPWPVVMLVAIVPVIVLGLASALAKLVTTHEEN